MFLSFEGIDGSGKSTQARMLADTLRARGNDVVLTREPGGSPGAEEIRRLVLTGDPDRWSPETEILLFTAARRDHLERTIRPALARGGVVITDRFADSTRMYQGLGLGVGPVRDVEDWTERRRLVEDLHSRVIGIEPDLTFLIDLDPYVGHARANARPGPEVRFESLGTALQARMRDGFLSLASRHSDRFRVIDGSGGPATVAARVLATFDGA